MIFRKLREGLRKTREKLSSGLSKLFGINRDLDEAFLMELEEVLYGADLGTTGLNILKQLRTEFKERKLKTTDDVKVRLREMLGPPPPPKALGDIPTGLARAESGPTIVLFVGSERFWQDHLDRQDGKVPQAAGPFRRARRV